MENPDVVPAQWEIQGASLEIPPRFRLDVSTLSIPAGQVHAVLGENGAGKTTLMEVLALLRGLDAGTVRIGGRDVRGIETSLRRRMGYADAQPYLLRGRTEENLDAAARLRRLEGSLWRRQKEELIRLFDLGHHRAKWAGGLSAGERKRLALARAWVGSPEMLVLDEPASNLDAQFASRLEAYIREHARARAATVVLTTHDLAQAWRVSDSIHRLAGGRLVPPLPENTFLGEIRTREDGESVFRTRAGWEFIVLTPIRGRAVAEIGPQEILLSHAPPDTSARNTVLSDICAIEERRGTEILIRVEKPEPLSCLVTPQSLARLSLQRGAAVYLTFKASAVQVT